MLIQLLLDKKKKNPQKLKALHKKLFSTHFLWTSQVRMMLHELFWLKVVSRS